jgi:WhiB family redox-sensing transcriptional regulator
VTGTQESPLWSELSELDGWRLMDDAECQVETSPTKTYSTPPDSAFSGLLEEIVGDLSWQAKARCKGQDHLFFGTHVCDRECDGPAGCTARKEKGKKERVAKAKAICKECPVILDCKEWALRTRLPFGVAGGLTEKERTRVLKRRKEGKSRIPKQGGPLGGQKPQPQQRTRRNGSKTANGKSYSKVGSGKDPRFRNGNRPD